MNRSRNSRWWVSRFHFLDAKEKVDGSAKYSADIKLDGMLHAKILGSPHAHAKITRIDVTGAKKIPGVVEILTYENTPKHSFLSPRNPADVNTQSAG